MQLIITQGKEQDEGAVQAETRLSEDGHESREWTSEQFEFLAASDAPSAKLFARVLDILADAGPDGLPLDEIAKATGVEGLTMQKKFGSVTRWMRNRGMDNRWPIYWPKGNWAMTCTNAERWKQING